MKSMDNIKKLRGRPPVDSMAVLVRIGRQQLDALDAWSKEQVEPHSRPEAIRQILADYLKRRGYIRND
jgi:hypothetical protein